MLHSRRFFLKSTGALAASLAVTPLDLFAEEPAAGGAAPAVTKGKTLVLIFLRGGADGLNLVVPWKDPNYRRIRKSIALPSPGEGAGPGRVLDLDGSFGLHPKLAPLLPHFEAGIAVALHAVGHDRNTRSHFEEQDAWETAVIGDSLRADGWVNRHLLSTSGHGPIRAVAIGNALPRIMHGKGCAYAVHGIDDLALPGSRMGETAAADALRKAYACEEGGRNRAARELLAETAQGTLDGVDQLKGIVGRPYTPLKPYPVSELGGKLMQAARLIKSKVGVEVLEIDYDGWDTHQYQGGAEGTFANLAGGLAEAVSAFLNDLGDHAQDVLVMTLSDFGRTASENGTFGTDHGWANVMFAFGPAVRRADGKRLIGRWPGLAPDQLHEKRDLMHTTDFRDVMAEGLRLHLGHPDAGRVLPGRTFESVGLLA
ncbi:MAG: DUF1501 domain-containing protein [Candidatus Brocadiae bacterium]|nr:DUF1501 domain-containing protein [Candidatus Brocadiia bacterium]